MISTLKQGDYFQPMDDLKHAIHIIGCGAIGSTLATMLVRMGVPKIYLYDFDIVEMKNICNQEYFDEQVGLEKTKSLTQTLQLINPSVNVIEKEKWERHRLSHFLIRFSAISRWHASERSTRCRTRDGRTWAGREPWLRRRNERR